MFQLFAPRTTILFYPDLPPRSFVAYKLCRFLGYRITKNPKRQYDVAFKRQDKTHTDPAILNALPVDVDQIVNGKSHDISKKKVDAVQEEVFGYPITLDPTKHQGTVLKKKDENALRDCEIISCPISPEAVERDCVYQKLINNEVGDGTILDLRVPIHGSQIAPIVILKYRPLGEKRFTKVARAELAATESVFSEQERDQLIRFAQVMGIDYGEFDVLRDNDDGRIYVVDTNNTPWGPEPKLPKPVRRQAIERMAPTFRDMIERFFIDAPAIHSQATA